MPRSLVRSLLSTVVAVCFTLAVTSWGRPPECASHTATSGHDASHDRQQGHDHAPAAQGCAVHLCCAHLAPVARAALAAGRLGELPADAGFAAASAVVAHRPEHALPFANAPPRPIV
jgi:hypothetical protein